MQPPCIYPNGLTLVSEETEVLQTRSQKQCKLFCALHFCIPMLVGRGKEWAQMSSPLELWPRGRPGKENSMNIVPHDPVLLRILSATEEWSQGTMAKASSPHPWAQCSGHTCSPRQAGHNDRSLSISPPRRVRWLYDCIPMNQRWGQRSSKLRWKYVCLKSKLSWNLAPLPFLW